MRVLALVLLAAPAVAQEETTAAEQVSPPEGPVAEALAEGYEPRPEEEPAGSLAGGLLAVFPGVIVHGAGHWYVGDTPTAARLLIAELAGVVLVVSSELLGAATNDSGELGAPRRLLTYAGGLLFMGSWAADIIGSFKGSSSFDDDSSRTEGRMFSLGYRFTSDPLTPFRHHLVTIFDFDTGLIYVRPSIDIEADLDTRRGEMDLGLRVFRGDNPHNHVAVGGRLRRDEVKTYGLASWGAAGYVAWKADLGLVIRSLRNLYLVSRIGGGAEFYQFADSTNRVPSLFASSDFNDPYFLLDVGFALNSGRRTHLSFLVRQDPTFDIAPVDTGFGLFEASLTHRYSDDIDIDVRFTGGDGWAMWLGLGYGL